MVQLEKKWYVSPVAHKSAIVDEVDGGVNKLRGFQSEPLFSKREESDDTRDRR